MITQTVRWREGEEDDPGLTCPASKNTPTPAQNQDRMDVRLVPPHFPPSPPQRSPGTQPAPFKPIPVVLSLFKCAARRLSALLRARFCSHSSLESCRPPHSLLDHGAHDLTCLSLAFGCLRC